MGKLDSRKGSLPASESTVFLFLAAVLQFLSVGPDLVAIWGLKAKKYLAVDNKGRIFSSVSLQQFVFPSEG